MQLVDTHCHLDFPVFDADRAAVIDSARRAGVTQIVVPGVDAARWPKLMALCAAHAGLHPALGLHPGFLARHRREHLQALETALEAHRPLAVGEIGLDYFIENPDRDAQKRLLEAQLAIAANAGLPVLLHVRKAHDDVLQLLRRRRGCGGIAHAFNGSLQQGKKYFELGFRLGFGGMLTYERSRKLRKLAAELPLEAIVLETDAPDMAVASHHGERNSPQYLPECLAALAEVRGQDPEELARRTTANAAATLGLAC